MPISSMGRRTSSVSGLHDVQCIGVTAGASAPELLVQQVVERLQDWGGQLVEEQSGVAEKVNFPIPKALQAH